MFGWSAADWSRPATNKVKVRLRLHYYICPKGHLSGSLEKACNLTYVNKGEATVIRRKRDGKRSRLEIKRRVKNGLRTSRNWFGLRTESSEGSRASAPQKKSQAGSRKQKQGSRRLSRSIKMGITYRQDEMTRQALFQHLQRVKLVVYMYRKVIQPGLKGSQKRRFLFTPLP